MSSSTAPHGLVDRVQDFVAENKKAVLIGAAVATVAVGGAFYYASSSSAPGGGERRSKKKSSKDKSEKSKKKTVKDADGPLLEEVEAPALEDTLNDEQIAALPLEQRSKIAASFKQKGNSAYQSRKFEEAAVLYTRAIANTPKAEPVFYSNRAACYMNMSPPAFEKVVADCDEALKLDKNYLKAMNRRATALESLERYEEALRDFTAAAILDRFQNKATGDAVERVLKAVTGKRAAEILASRQPRLPSYTFISAYFAAFRPRPHPALPEEPAQGDQTLQLAFEALDAASYIHSFTLVQEAVEQGISSDEARGEALNLRGTFKFLMGDVEGAKNDLLQSLQFAPGLTQSLVKLASVYMEQGEPEKAAQSFDDAQGMNPDDPDIYYHRGQVLFIMNQFASAADNYTKSTELDDTFVFSHIQYAVAEYKQGNIAKSMAAFRRTLGAFPQRSEPYNYYGELLLDQQHFGEAIEKFERAFELEKARTDNKIPNVLPLVNKGLTMYQWKQEIAPAEEACNEALTIDPECDAAVATLAQLSLQQGKIDEAVKYFEKQVELARTEPEVTGALTYEYATRSQAAFLQNYPEMAAQLNQMAKAMG